MLSEPKLPRGKVPESAPPFEPVATGRLDSWKEIAGYLGRDIRTVQLWEKREGLPVHRHTHATRASVYAYTEELDAWRAGRRPRVADEDAEDGTEVAEASVPATNMRWRRPVLIGIAVALGITAIFGAIAVWHQFRLGRNVIPEGSTLAVLPFQDLSPAPSENYLADGLTDELITDLSQSHQLNIISRTSSSQFGGKQSSLTQIAHALHANLVLEGSVTRSAERVRVTAQLINAEDDRHIWAESYEREAGDVLWLQDRIADDIARAILKKVSGTPPVGHEPVQEADSQAREAYLMGRFFWNKRDAPSLKTALGLFQKAIDRDPNYAAAYAGLADCYNLLGVWGTMSGNEAFPKAREAAGKALEIDPASAAAHTSLAFVTYRYDWDFAGADAEFRRAIELDPNYATAHQWYGEFLGDLRRFDRSIAESKRAVELDPLSAMAVSDLADSYLHAKKYKEAIVELQHVLTMYPDFVPAHSYLASVYDDVGDKRKADQEKQECFRLTGDKSVGEVESIRRAWAKGNKREARARLDRLSQFPNSGQFDAYALAGLYLELGDKEKAYRWLDKAYQEHSWWMVTLLADPGFESVRNEPRFLALLARVGLPQN
jgi:TolB-like protein/Tfp pilus assembly protein PilF